MKNSITSCNPTSHRTVCLEITRLGDRTSIAGFIRVCLCHFDQAQAGASKPSAPTVARRGVSGNDNLGIVTQLPSSVISTRLLAAFPAAVSLVATGFWEPCPAIL